MISLDEDALICDLAETYQIYDSRQLPPSRMAVFASGLKNDSRIKMIITGQKGKNKPAMLVEFLTSGEKKQSKDVVVFNSGEDFKKSRIRLIGGG